MVNDLPIFSLATLHFPFLFFLFPTQDKHNQIVEDHTWGFFYPFCILPGNLGCFSFVQVQQFIENLLLHFKLQFTAKKPSSFSILVFFSCINVACAVESMSHNEHIFKNEAFLFLQFLLKTFNMMYGLFELDKK